MRWKKWNKGEERAANSRKPKGAIEALPKKQCEPQLEPITKGMPMHSKKSWSSPLKSLKEEDQKDVPIHFKSYSIQERDIFCEKAKRIVDTYDDGVYGGPTKVKEVNLVGSGETPKPVFVSVDLTKEEEGDLIALLKEYKDYYGYFWCGGNFMSTCTLVSTCMS